METEMDKSMIPPLSNDLHKGQSGRVLLLAGSDIYTGACYFSGISALKMGIDLIYIFTTPGATNPLKTYSPNFIIYPFIQRSNNWEQIDSILSKVHSVIIGPGLGKDQLVLDFVEEIVCKIKAYNIPMIIDADGLWCISRCPNIIHGYTNSVLTPNTVEFRRLCSALNIEEKGDFKISLNNLSAALGNVPILLKGQNDLLTDGKVENIKEIIIPNPSPRRCGGQGDILSGVIGAFLAWSGIHNQDSFLTYESIVPCVTNSCSFTKCLGKVAFGKHKRSMNAEDMIAEIGPLFDKLFDQEGG